MCSDGSGTIVLSIEDNGEPGSNGGPTNDRIAITVKDKNGNLFYASNGAYTVPTAYPTMFKNLVGGNIQIRSTSVAKDPDEIKVAPTPVAVTSAPSQVSVAERVIALQPTVEKLEAKAYPNPSVDQFSIKLESNSKEPIRLEIFNEIGRLIEVKNNLIAGQTLQLGSEYRMGTYFVKIIQGKMSKVLKIVKIN